MSYPQSYVKSSKHLDMHGLIFKTSVYLLAGSTR